MKGFVGNILFVLCFLFGDCMSWKEMVVVDPVANLRLLDERGALCDRVLSSLGDDHMQNSQIYDRAPSIFFRDNPQQETQLLFGERVLAEPFVDGWLRVRVPGQKVFRDGLWQAVQGFVGASSLGEFRGLCTNSLTVVTPWARVYKHSSMDSKELVSVSFGTCLSGIKRQDEWWVVETPVGTGAILAGDVLCCGDREAFPLDILRMRLVAAARLFLGGPYVWGGCSFWQKHVAYEISCLRNVITGIDCSGLIYLIFKAHGLLVARNSHDQFLMSESVASGNLLLPGDVIFFANPDKNPPRVNHVMLYVGRDSDGCDLVLEASGSGVEYGVRVMRTTEYNHFGNKNLKELKNGQCVCWVHQGEVCRNIIYFGSFLSIEKRALLHKAFLQTICYNN